MAQKLSKEAAARKKARDLKYAKTDWRKYCKRTAQAKKCGKGKDFDHDSGKCISSKKNRSKNSRSGAVARRYGFR